PAQRRGPARQSARHLCQCDLMVTGDEPMTAIRFEQSVRHRTGSGGKPAIAPVLMLTIITLAGCAASKVPQFSYDDHVPPLPSPPAAVADPAPKPLHVPPDWTPARGGGTAETPEGRISNANTAARV